MVQSQLKVQSLKFGNVEPSLDLPGLAGRHIVPYYIYDYPQKSEVKFCQVMNDEFHGNQDCVKDESANEYPQRGTFMA